MSSTFVTTERSFTPPVQSVTGTSSVQTTGVVTQVSIGPQLTGSSSGQFCGPAIQSAVINQPSDVPDVMSLVQPTGPATSQNVAGAAASTDIQFTGTVSQPISSKMSLAPVTLTGAAAHSLDPYSDVERYIVSLPPLLSPWRRRVRYLTVSLPNLSKILSR